MIKKFYIFENSLYSYLNDIGDLDENEESLQKLIGFDSSDYKLDVKRYNSGCFGLIFKEDFLCDFFEIESGAISYAKSIVKYDYDYDVDRGEIDYISNYFSDENKNKFNTIIEKLDLIISIDDNEEIGHFFELTNKIIDYKDFLMELSMAIQPVIVNNMKKVFKKLPFDVEVSGVGRKNDIILEFSVDEIGTYIDEHKLENINTIEDFLHNIDMSDFDIYSYENYWEFDETPDYSSLVDTIDTELEKIIDELDDVDEIDYKSIFDDPKQLSLFKDDDIPKLANNYSFLYDFFSKLDVEYIKYAKKLGGKILAWFNSYDFQKMYMTKDGSPTKEKYDFLIANCNLNSKIKDEYEHLETMEEFNL